MYISGMWYGSIYDSLQVGIPVDAEKVNTKTTEEVSLPPSAPHKPIVAEKILISQLDNVAKLVFATTKRLNEVIYLLYIILLGYFDKIFCTCLQTLTLLYLFMYIHASSHLYVPNSFYCKNYPCMYNISILASMNFSAFSEVFWQSLKSRLIIR